MVDDEARIRAALSDGYAIDREVGRGGMATVYLAEEVKHGRSVAIKVLHPDIAASLGRERFLREIEIVAKLRHRGILPLYDSGEADGLLYYVMPFVEGDSLRARLDREKQLPVDEALRITSELAAALDEAHEHGVIHRDIKPGNVLFEGDQPLIADFGVATALEEAGGEKLTRTGVAVGTPSYMSPEQAAGGQADARSDEYALACVLYEMLGGVPPFTGPTPQAVMARHALDPVPDLGTVRSTVPDGVIAAVERAMAKVPADRYPSAGALAEALAKGDEKRAGRSPKRLSRRLTAGLPAVAVVVALFGFGLSRTLRPAVPTAASKMAIFPLIPTVEGDSALGDLGRGLSVFLAHNLNGVGEIETEPGVSMLSAAAGGVLGMEEAAELARTTFGASSVLTGTLVRTGDRVQAYVQLHTADSTISFLTDASATAHSDSVVPFANALAHNLLAQIWQRGDAPTPQVEAALGTDSLKALKKFLEGEMAYVDARMDEAGDLFEQAFRIDTTFWIAAAMYGNTRAAWDELSSPDAPGPDSTITRTLLAHVDELPEPQRTWVRTAPWRFGVDPTVWHPGTTRKELVDNYRLLADQHWDFWPIVADCGDLMLHYGSFWGYRRAEAARILERAVELMPEKSWVEWHLGLAQYAEDSRWQSLVELADSLPGDWTDSLRQRVTTGVVCEAYMGQATDSSKLRQAREALVAKHAHAAGDPDNFLYAFTYRFFALLRGTPRCLVDGFAPFIPLEPEPRNRAWYHLAAAFGWAGSGAWDSASVHIQEAAKGPDPTATLAVYRLAVAGAWLGHVGQTQVSELRPYAERAARRAGDPSISFPWGNPDPDLPRLLAEQSWLDGVLAFASEDPDGLDLARSEIPAGEDRTMATFSRSLRAFALALEGDRAAAADSLYVLEMLVPPDQVPVLWASRIFEEMPVLHAVNRLAAGRWLLARGDTVRAEALLHWQENVHPPAVKVSGFAAPLARLELARIAEARADYATAREHYLWFLRSAPIDYNAELGTEARAAVARIDEELAAREGQPAGDPDG